jgi:hypothetical protein
MKHQLLNMQTVHFYKYGIPPKPIPKYKTLAAENAHHAYAKYHKMPSPNHVGKTLVT